MTNSANPSMDIQKPVPEPEEKHVKPIFAPVYYVSHIYMVLYILVGLGIQTQYYLTGKIWRVLSVATWPWVLTGSPWLLMLAVILYGVALYTIAKQVRGKLEEMEISWYTLAPYILFAFVWLAMLGRLIIYYISPDGLFFDKYIQGN